MADNIEARMNFIIEQRAQFGAGIQDLKERQIATQPEIDGMKTMMRQLVDVSMSLARHAEETDQHLRGFGEETDRRIRALAESGAHIDQRLDILVNVDNLVRRNGP